MKPQIATLTIPDAQTEILLREALEIIRSHGQEGEPQKHAFAKAGKLTEDGDTEGALHWTRVGTLIDSLVEDMPVTSVH